MMEENTTIILILVIGGIGLAYGFWNVLAILSISPKPQKRRIQEKQKEAKENLISSKDVVYEEFSEQHIEELKNVNKLISAGTYSFVWREYLWILPVIIIFVPLIQVSEHKMGTFYMTTAFILGALYTVICGYICIFITLSVTSRTAYLAFCSFGEAYNLIYHGACALGFIFQCSGIMMIAGLCHVYMGLLGSQYHSVDSEYRMIFECVAGYSLGGSMVSLFTRMGGGIYKKATDVGADLVGKLHTELKKEDIENSLNISGNVGDIVCHILGVGNDMCENISDATCAVMIVSTASKDLTANGAYYYPLLIFSAGIVCAIITSIVPFVSTKSLKNLSSLSALFLWQTLISTVFMIPCIYFISIICLPSLFTVGSAGGLGYREHVSPLNSMICVFGGMLSALCLALFTQHYTSINSLPVQELMLSSKKGSSMNAIFGLAHGYGSSWASTLLMVSTIFGAYQLAGIVGISYCILGLLSNISLSISINAFGPLCDVTKGYTDICKVPKRVKTTLKQIKTVGKNSAALRKGIAFGSACMISFSLCGVFMIKASIKILKLKGPVAFFSVIIGTMLPYIFSSFTLRAVAIAAERQMEGIKKEIRARSEPSKNSEEIVPNVALCLQISIKYALTLMLTPGLLIIVIIMITGVVLGPQSVVAMLIGLTISGFQLGTSFANTGSAWDRCKEYIKSEGVPMTQREMLENELRDLQSMARKFNSHDLKVKNNAREVTANEIESKKSELLAHIQLLNNAKSEKNIEQLRKLNEFKLNKDEKRYSVVKKAKKASVTCDNIGDPMKDTCCPALIILMKVSPLMSIIFATVFQTTSYLTR